MEKFCKQMKALSKIAVLIGFIVFVSSCQKEDDLSPQGCPSHESSATQRASNSSGIQEDPDPSDIKGEKGGTEDDVIGGGDDDRDGGGKKVKKEDK